MTDNDKPVRLIRRQVKFIWVTYTVAPLLLLFVARQLIINRTAPPAEIFGWAAPACIVLSVIMAISALVIFGTLPRRMLRPMPSLHSRIVKHPAIGEEDKKAALVASGAGKLMIILSAFSMSCTVYGLIIVILGGQLWNMFPFVAVSLILQAIFWPGDRFFRRVEEKLRNG